MPTPSPALLPKGAPVVVVAAQGVDAEVGPFATSREGGGKKVGFVEEGDGVVGIGGNDGMAAPVPEPRKGSGVGAGLRGDKKGACWLGEVVDGARSENARVGIGRW